MAAAIPFALKAGTALAGSFLGKKLSGPNKQQQAGVAGTQQAGAQVGGMVNPLYQTSKDLTSKGGELINQGQNYAAGGRALVGEGAGNLQQAGDYYKGVLGSRAGMRQALAPETATIMDYYKGATGQAQRTMRGAQRDTAVAELNRDRVGNLARTTTGARAGAAEGLGRVGAETVGAANPLFAQAQSLYGTGSNLTGVGSNYAGQATNAAAQSGYLNNAVFNQGSTLDEQARTGGKAWGGMLYDLANSFPWGKKGGGGAKALPNLFMGF